MADFDAVAVHGVDALGLLDEFVPAHTSDRFPKKLMMCAARLAGVMPK